MGEQVPSVREVKKGEPKKRCIELPNLEHDIAEMRRKAWANFPREEFCQ